MRVLVSGSSGLIGSAVAALLQARKHAVVRLVRHSPAAEENALQWDPQAGRIDAEGLAGIEGVVHLAGENIAKGRWTKAKRARIRDSRVDGTRLLAETLARLTPPPRVFVSASAIGYYGDRGDEELDESSSPGQGFLAEVCRDWEAATAPAAEAGIRVVNTRFGVVFAAEGGALPMMARPIRLGIGGRIGSGRQYVSWVSLDDAAGAVHRALFDDALAGPVNVTSPQPVTNRRLTKSLGRVLGRPTLFSLPAFAARLLLGQMADNLLLASARVVPRRLLETDYVFRDVGLEPALQRLLKSS